MISFLRRMLPYLAVTLAAALIYDGWIFYSRWRDRQDAEQQRTEREAESARRTIDALGGGALTILNFYASPGAIRRGEHAQLCYGVYGAESVRIDPPVGELHLSVAHCVEVAPVKTTEYTLTATDRTGHTTSQRLLLRVR
jgi:hypothetical protein